MTIIKNLLITGCNRGIGLELCKQLSQMSSIDAIIATTRDRQKSNDLNRLSANCPKVNVLELETRDYRNLDKFLNECHLIVHQKGLNLLINSAGIISRDNLWTLTEHSLLSNFETNAIAPLMLTRKLLPLLKTSANNGFPTSVVNISSTLGSMATKVEAGKEWYPYRVSKASLNMITKLLASDLGRDGIRAIGIHPGWVRTDMGTKNALLEPEFAVKNIIKILLNIEDSINGQLVNYDGKVLQL